jgi:hypothetical protein
MMKNQIAGKKMEEQISKDQGIRIKDDESKAKS